MYTLDDTEVRDACATLIRHPTVSTGRTVEVHWDEGHIRPIVDMSAYARSYRCRNCSSQWHRAHALLRHQTSCARASPYRFVGGPYSPPADFVELLAELGIVVATEHRYYPYRATYDLEACLMRPAPEDGKRFTAVHVPMSASVASNVPGHEGPHHFVSTGDPYIVVRDMVRCLTDIADEAYRLVSDVMAPYSERLEELRHRHVQETEQYCDDDDTDPTEENVSERLTSSAGARALSKARAALEVWMRRMPAVSFNGSRYDLKLIKPYLCRLYGVHTPVWLSRFRAYEKKTQDEDDEHDSPTTAPDGDVDEPDTTDAITCVLKKGTRMTAIFTRKLIFLDICNYLPPVGINYSKYLSTYGVGAGDGGGKSFFPYEFVDELSKLDGPLPPYEAFHSSLRRGNTLDECLSEAHGRENYEELHHIWAREGMT